MSLTDRIASAPANRTQAGHASHAIDGSSHASGFWIVAIAFAVMMAFTTVPTPLYALYQERDGFATVIVSAIFAAYGVGVMVALYLAGHISDQIGRRRTMLAASALLIVAAALFLVDQRVPMLLIARLVTGLGIGMLSATATAYLGDLRERQGRNAGLAATVAGIANLGGLALGPLVGGAFAEWNRQPLVSPYVVFLVALVAIAFAITRTPETVHVPRAERLPWRPQRVSMPSEHRGAFWAAGIGGFAAFAVLGFFGSVAPTFLARVIGNPDHLLAGVTAFLAFGAAALSQVVFARLALRTQLLIGTGAMLAGLVSIAAGELIPSLAAFLAGAVVAGAGVGLVFRGALATAGRVAAPQQRGQVLAGVFLLAYAGMTLVPMLVGVALVWLPLVPTAVGFVALILVLIAWAGPFMRRRVA